MLLKAFTFELLKKKVKYCASENKQFATLGLELEQQISYEWIILGEILLFKKIFIFQ